MNELCFNFAGARLAALPSGALWWADASLLCVSDLHLGKAERMVRRGAGPLPPYDTTETLSRLQSDLDRTKARQVVCLGDSFDDVTAAHSMPETDRMWIARLQAGRQWIWIEGNHDPAPVHLGGTHLATLNLPPLVFRHIAQPGTTGEVSGHYHPKAQVRTRARTITRAAFLRDADRLIMPAYGTYTGGLRSSDPVFSTLLSSDAKAILTGPQLVELPMPR